jgi:hypothetical protein
VFSNNLKHILQFPILSSVLCSQIISNIFFIDVEFVLQFTLILTNISKIKAWIVNSALVRAAMKSASSSISNEACEEGYMQGYWNCYTITELLATPWQRNWKVVTYTLYICYTRILPQLLGQVYKFSVSTTRRTSKGKKVRLSFQFQLKAMSLHSDEANRGRVHESLLVEGSGITNIAFCFIFWELLCLIIHPGQTIPKFFMVLFSLCRKTVE